MCDKNLNSTYENLLKETISALNALVEIFGKKSIFNDELSLTDTVLNFNIGIKGHFVREIQIDKLLDNYGLEYSFHCLGLAELADLREALHTQILDLLPY